MSRRKLWWSAIIAWAGVSSCFAEPGPLTTHPRTFGGAAGIDGSGGSGAADGGGSGPIGGQNCVSPVKASEHLLARANVMSDSAVSAEREVFVADLFEQFRAECGACHVEQANGDFQVHNATEFFLKVDEETLDAIRNDDPEKFMPPPTSGGMKWADRETLDDPVTRLVKQLEFWIAEGRPADVYHVANDGASDKPYLFSTELGMGLTNLGTCIPQDGFAFGSAAEEMDELDDMFKTSERAPLPDDPQAPRPSPEKQLGLPRFLKDTDLNTFDSATLARHGVVAFVPTYPLWTAGAGKLRHVRVPRGKSIHYDAETREFEIPPNTRFYKTFFKEVIDRDGNPTWRKMETRLIVSRPEKVVDGQRVQMALFGSYQWDEEESEATLVTIAQRNTEPFKDLIVTYTPDEPEAQKIRDSMPQNLTYELEFAGLIKHYAIPGRERCTHCHMGSPSASFVLGFTPMQLRRRATDEGGTYEPTGDDELHQLQRLITYGVVTGLDSEDEVPLLEDSEGDRKPRNDYELKAQAYMFGNCGHCHNPNGFPSTAAPELKPLLDFWPDREGGIFQFPLERFSPRIRRGAEANPIAYITPSLRDIWPHNWLDNPSFTPKIADGLGGNLLYYDAPWRSLVYRNVQTTYTYADDWTIYPHMPMDTAGYDCRAFRTLGDWMVSIPAKRKHPELNEHYYPKDGNIIGLPEAAQTDMEPQPYIEVSPDDPGYADAVIAAEKRLNSYHAGKHYNSCPGDVDIVDPAVRRGDRLAPIDTSIPPDGVPDLPHWVDTDLTERAGLWAPRREDWDKVFLEDDPSSPTPLVVTLLRDIKLDQGGFKTFARTPRPMATWTDHDGCDFSTVPKASSFTGQNRPYWLDVGKVASDKPIFSAWPGQAVFDMICTNCHGRQADSKGRMADTVQVLTGGTARVANLRDGLFGAPGMAGGNRARVLDDAQMLLNEDGSIKYPGLATWTADDFGSRYMAWMALGGTQRQLPPIVLTLVAKADVYGTSRAVPLMSPSDIDANMLSTARAACRNVLPRNSGTGLGGGYRYNVLLKPFSVDGSLTGLIEENGDAELWLALCSQNNPAPIRGVRINTGGQATVGTDLYPASMYPAGTPVGLPGGNIAASLDSATNYFPWCVIPAQPADPNYQAVQDFLNAWNAPLCPAQLAPFAFTPDDVERWAVRGAINAGFSVFVFLDAVARGELKPIRPDECQLIGAQ